MLKNRDLVNNFDIILPVVIGSEIVVISKHFSSTVTVLIVYQVVKGSVAVPIVQVGWVQVALLQRGCIKPVVRAVVNLEKQKNYRVIVFYMWVITSVELTSVFVY